MTVLNVVAALIPGLIARGSGVTAPQKPEAHDMDKPKTEAPPAAPSHDVSTAARWAAFAGWLEAVLAMQMAKNPTVIDQTLCDEIVRRRAECTR